MQGLLAAGYKELLAKSQCISKFDEQEELAGLVVEVLIWDDGMMESLRWSI